MSRVIKVLGRLVFVLLLLSGCAKETAPVSALGTLNDPPEGFRQAEAGMAVELPEDLGAHPEYRLEWWYLTANLHSANGEQFGVQWTLFRNGLKPGPYRERQPGWQRNEIWLAHAALSRANDHHFADRIARGGTGQAGVTADPFTAWIDHWQIQSTDTDSWTLAVDGEDFSYQLNLRPHLAAILNGEQGFSAKSAGGGGSMYFSYPYLAIEGEVEVGGERFQVEGKGWFDREWSSQYLNKDQQGWDWLALHLDDGRHLMVFRVRGTEDFYSGTLVAADGSARTLDANEFTLEPVDYRQSRFGRVPVVWKLQIPLADLDLDIQSWPGDYWNPGALRYWEGPVTVTGTSTGEGYLEMTGYGN